MSINIGRMELKASWVLVILIVLIFSIFFFAKNWDEEQEIKMVKYSGLTYLTSSELNEALGKGIIGSVKGAIDPDTIRNRLSPIVFIEDFSIIYPANGVLEIAVVERYPVAIAINPKGESRLIDNNGVILPYRNIAGIQGLVVIKCESKCKSFAKKMKSSIGILNMIHDKCDEKFLASISEISFNSDTESYELILNSSFNRILLGDISLIENSFEKLLKFLGNEKITQENVIYEYIDLRWTGQIVVHEAA